MSQAHPSTVSSPSPSCLKPIPQLSQPHPPAVSNPSPRCLKPIPGVSNPSPKCLKPIPQLALLYALLMSLGPSWVLLALWPAAGQEPCVAHISLMECIMIAHYLHIVWCFNRQLDLKAGAMPPGSDCADTSRTRAAAQQHGVTHISLTVVTCPRPSS